MDRMNEKHLLNKLSDEIARVLWLPDELIVREVLDVDDLVDAKKQLLSVLSGAAVALQIPENARPKSRH